MNLPFEPMKLARRDAPFDHPDWLFQVKWDGVRCVALVAENRVRLFGRYQRERTGGFPELDHLPEYAPGRRFVLDGELIALRAGRPSFHGVLERWLGSPAAASAAAVRLPVVYMAFDLLELDGVDLIERPLSERLERLSALIQPAAGWQVVETFPQMGRRLFRSAVEQDMEGIVCKHRMSPYRPGVRSDLWYKVKRRQRRLCVVCGYTEGGLVLGAFRQGELIYIGRAGSGLTAEHLRLLREHLPSGPMPFAATPNLRSRFAGQPREVMWVEPRLTVLIEYLEWTEDGKLREPVVVGFTGEPPAEARLED